MGEQGVLLKDRIYLTAVGRDAAYVLAVYQYLAVVGQGKARYKAQHGSFAAAGGAEQGKELAVAYIEVYIL